jgi:RNA polymerase sigma factor (sigma-70 family)
MESLEPTMMTDSQHSTRSLVRLGRQGDGDALDRLFGRMMSRVRRWAHHRFSGPRRMNETADIIQDATVGVWRRLDRLDLQRPGDLEAYLRQAVLNRIRDEGRRRARVPDPVPLDLNLPAKEPTVLERAMGNQTREQYRAAFARLRDDERDVIIARLDMGHSFEAIAELLNRPSAAAARMAFGRAIARLRQQLTSDASDA